MSIRTQNSNPAGPFWQSLLLRLFCPDAYLTQVTEVDPARLVALGIRGVLLDYDNTIAPWHGRTLSQPVQAWIREMQASGLTLCILSNAIRMSRVQGVAGSLKIHYVGRAFKPVPFAFRRALHQLDLRSSQVAMIGDQLFTDTIGGNLVGLYTILVRPVSKEEFVTTRLVRRVERKLLSWMAAKGKLTLAG